MARQNHVIFGRRGCGKTLLLHFSAKKVRSDVRVVYVNCEDYKQHSFPDVLIEILDQLFGELESNLSGWFGKKKRSRELIQEIRSELAKLKRNPDERNLKVRESTSSKDGDNASVALSVNGLGIGRLPRALERQLWKRCTNSVTAKSIS